jgi:outer membrane protein OmpA-like peptidoglycan-associated protein
MGRRTPAVVAAIALAVVGVAVPVVASGAEPDGELRSSEPRIRDVAERIRDVEARIEDVVVPTEEGADIPVASDVLFAFGSAELDAGAERQLSGVVDHIRGVGASRVVIEGHTDAVGDEAANQRLSEQRADAVRVHLIERLPGVALDAVGCGESRPVAPNEAPDGSDDPAGRQQNRRVTFVVEG